MEILNKSFEDHIEIKKGQPSGFLGVEPENLKFQQVSTKKKDKQKGKERLYLYNKKGRQEAF